MKNLIILAFVLVFFVNFGCNDNSTKVIAQSELIPLHVNNFWVYKTTIIDSNNNITEVLYDTLKLLKDTSIYSKTYFISSINNCFSSNSWGLFQILNLKSYDKELAVYKYPCSLNESYTVIDSATVFYYDTKKNDTVRADYVIANIDTSISVPSGTYSCIYYKPKTIDKYNNTISLYPFLTPKTWISPNIGIVKMELLFHNYGKNTIIKELVNYELY